MDRRYRNQRWHQEEDSYDVKPQNVNTQVDGQHHLLIVR